MPLDLKNTVDDIVQSDDTSMARLRTAMARKWMLKAGELGKQERELKLTLPEHCSVVLKSKRLLVFEMLSECNHPDSKLCKDICHGFNLLGDLLTSCVFNSRSTFATLTPDQVRSTAKLKREAIFNSVSRDVDQDICEGVYEATLKEFDQGWLT